MAENNNAWLIRLGDEVHSRRFSVTVDHGSSLFRGVEEGDVVLIANGDSLAAVSFARIYRIRAKLDKTTFFFDGVLSVNGEKTLTDLGVTVPESKAAMVRLEWSVFEAALKTACGIAFDALPVLEGGSAEEQNYVRELLQLAVIEDLLGPADGPVEEIVGMSVRDRYLVGKLAPMDTAPDAAETDTFGESGRPDSEERDDEVDTSTNQSIPGSIVHGVHLLRRRRTGKCPTVRQLGALRTDAERAGERRDGQIPSLLEAHTLGRLHRGLPEEADHFR